MRKLHIKMLYILVIFAFIFCKGQNIAGTWKFNEISIETNSKELENACIDNFYQSGLQYNYLNLKKDNTYELVDGLLYKPYYEGKYSYGEEELLLDDATMHYHIDGEYLYLTEQLPDFSGKGEYEKYIKRSLENTCPLNQLSEDEFQKLKITGIIYKLKFTNSFE